MNARFIGGCGPGPGPDPGPGMGPGPGSLWYLAGWPGIDPGKPGGGPGFMNPGGGNIPGGRFGIAGAVDDSPGYLR